MSNYLVCVALLIPFTTFAANIDKVEALWKKGKRSINPIYL
jgi:hypothetical protein